MTPTLPPDHTDRLTRASLALEGLSLGDAYGELFFQARNNIHAFDDEPWLPTQDPWCTTDDTAMALGIVEVLTDHGHVHQDKLAKVFARNFRRDPGRGYGPGAIRLLTSVANGGLWRLEARTLFSGMGSYGNGTAMRIAPLGAYFAEDGYQMVCDEARLASAVTHAHPEGQAGGMAVAVAAAYAWTHRGQDFSRADFFETLLTHTPKGEVYDGLRHAETIEDTMSVRGASSLLGNGRKVSCQDTVPFCVWMMAHHWSNYERAIWETIQVGGDIDTNCAIIGGVVVLNTGLTSLPAAWLAKREAIREECP
ncbi:MAG: ADP-ribosylglycohydrolase family protein [Fimbriiglobus sp.]